MITDEEIKRIVRSIAEPETEDPFEGNADMGTLSLSELKSLYQLGRQHQRESDAALCQVEYDDYGYHPMSALDVMKELPEKVRANTGELK